MTRESVSRPNWSVPNQCAAFGGREADDRIDRLRIVGRQHGGEDRGEDHREQDGQPDERDRPRQERRQP